MFEKKERVLCYHGGFLYDAKIVKRELLREKDKEKENEAGNEYRYLIHYVGWNKNRDEWVPAERVIECNEANLKEQQRLNDDQAGTSYGSHLRPHKKLNSNEDHLKKNTSTNTNNAEVVAGVKEEESIENSEDEKAVGYQPTENEELEPEGAASLSTEAKNYKKLITIEIPRKLKCCLFEDWLAVKRENVLYEIPMKPSVQDVLNEYKAYKEAIEDPSVLYCDRDVIPYMYAADGLMDYFNAAFGYKLLYANERPQYKKVMEENPSKKPSDLYGYIHLLRLFLRIGPILDTLGMNYNNMKIIVNSIYEVVKFLEDNSEKYFTLQDEYDAVAEKKV